MEPQLTMPTFVAGVGEPLAVGREAGLELREDVDTIIEAGMVISMEPMLTIPSGIKGSGGYREHDIIVVNENNTDNITKFPFGPENNIICI